MKTVRMTMFLIVSAMVMMIVNTSCNQTCVVATQQCAVGIDASYDQVRQLPTGKLGLINNALTIVPTNKPSEEYQNESTKGTGGAKDTANVLMEITIPSLCGMIISSKPVYQRIAVGDLAVTQPGAVAMMARNDTGGLTDTAVQMIKALSGTKTYSEDQDVLKSKSILIKLYRNGDENTKKQIMSELNGKGYATFDQFVDGLNKELTDKEINEIIGKLK